MYMQYQLKECCQTALPIKLPGRKGAEIGDKCDFRGRTSNYQGDMAEIGDTWQKQGMCMWGWTWIYCSQMHILTY